MNGLSTYLELAVSLVLTSLVACFWRPEGDWLPSAARAIDVYGTAAPTVPCLRCRALDWHKPAGHTGWICRMGRPPPDQSVGSAPA